MGRNLSTKKAVKGKRLPGRPPRDPKKDGVRTYLGLDSYLWVLEQAVEKNRTPRDIMERMIECAAMGKLYFFDRRMTKAEAAFYADASAAETRAASLRSELERYRKLKRASDAAKHSCGIGPPDGAGKPFD